MSLPSYPSLANPILSLLSPASFVRGLGDPDLTEPTRQCYPACSSSPISTIYTQSSTPSLTLAYYTESEPGSDADVPQSYDEFSAWTHQTPESVSELEGTQHEYPIG